MSAITLKGPTRKLAKSLFSHGVESTPELGYIIPSQIFPMKNVSVRGMDFFGGFCRCRQPTSHLGNRADFRLEKLVCRGPIFETCGNRLPSGCRT